MPRRDTYEEFIHKCAPFAEGRYDISEIKYTASKIKINPRCLHCNETWSVTPNSLLKGTGCPECARAERVARIREYRPLTSSPETRERSERDTGHKYGSPEWKAAILSLLNAHKK